MAVRISDVAFRSGGRNVGVETSQVSGSSETLDASGSRPGASSTPSSLGRHAYPEASPAQPTDHSSSLPSTSLQQSQSQFSAHHQVLHDSFPSDFPQIPEEQLQFSTLFLSYPLEVRESMQMRLQHDLWCSAERRRAVSLQMDEESACRSHTGRESRKWIYLGQRNTKGGKSPESCCVEGDFMIDTDIEVPLSKGFLAVDRTLR